MICSNHRYILAHTSNLISLLDFANIKNNTEAFNSYLKGSALQRNHFFCASIRNFWKYKTIFV